MNQTSQTSQSNTINPPKLIQSISAGFNLVANHLYLLLMPLALDLYLWFGPHLRLKSLMEPIFLEVQRQYAAITQLKIDSSLQAFQEYWSDILQHFNLFSLIRSYPIGVFSLFASSAPVDNPLGIPIMLEVPSIGSAFLYIIFITLIGLLFGTIFFREIARLSGNMPVFTRLRPTSWHYLQTVVLTLLLIALLFFIAIPLVMLISFLVIISPTIAQIALIIIAMFLLWLLVPMIFAPHGIYFNQQSALSSILSSVRMVRFYLPGASFFLMIVVLIGEGLNIIWRIPPANNWMAIIGVVGHAFVSTALLAATFAYYRNGLIWIQSRIQQIPKPASEDNGRIL
jgi:hypothetical protein